MSLSPGVSLPYPWPRDSEESGLLLIKLLHACASSVDADNIENANDGLGRIALLASPDGDSLQRIAVYFTHALADRILRRWPGLYRALNSTRISSVYEELHAQRLFFKLLPFLKLSHVLTNQAIVEAMEGEKFVHIIDLNSFEPAQLIELLKMLKARPEGPPHLKITGVHEHKEISDQMATRLTEEAERLNIPFQFHRFVTKLEKLDLEKLPVKSGEALAVISVLQLHSLLATDEEMRKKSMPSTSRIPTTGHLQRFLHMNQNQGIFGEMLGREYGPSPDSALSPLSPAPSPMMGSFLNALHSLSPKLVVITEQESDHNGFTLMERVNEAMNFYATLFDCLDSTESRGSLERQELEKMLFGEEIKNIVACEGMERKKRHEKLEKWILRFEVAGFAKVPVSYQGRLQANMLLGTRGFNGYEIREEKRCLVIYWHGKPLFSVSAWR